MITAEELLAGASLTFDLEVPAEVRAPGGSAGAIAGDGVVRIRPLTVHDLQLISRAARDSDALTAALMVQRALVDPALTVQQVAGMHVGLLEFLLNEVSGVSGISSTSRDVADAARTPVARAAFILSKEFGWTPDEVSRLTLGQVLLHLQMLGESAT